MWWRRLFVCYISLGAIVGQTLAWRYLKSHTIASLLVAGSPTSSSANICEKLRQYLVKRQKKICRRHPNLIASILYGYGMAWKECKRQFIHNRWDCSGHRNRNVFELLHNRGTREAAYLQAVTSAGVSHAVTKACSAGQHSKCGCDNTIYDYPNDEKHKWSGCSDHIYFGNAFTKSFIDSYERRTRKRYPALALTKLHNNRAGRQTVLSLMKVLCKCHGVSGSCEMKTCWRSLPKFHNVSGVLRSKFDRAVYVAYHGGRLISRDSRFRNFGERDLVYLRPSPDFCMADEEAGSVGTKNRVCNKTMDAPNNCNSLCCHRGFTTRLEVQVRQCNCKFVWCCKVKCDQCRVPVEISKCL